MTNILDDFTTIRVETLSKVLEAYTGEVALSIDLARCETTLPPHALACEGKFAKYALDCYSVAPASDDQLKIGLPWMKART